MGPYIFWQLKIVCHRSPDESWFYRSIERGKTLHFALEFLNAFDTDAIMNRFVEGENRSQSLLFPERLDDYIDEDNPVRASEVFVDGLDLKSLGFEGMMTVPVSLPMDCPLYCPRRFPGACTILDSRA